MNLHFSKVLIVLFMCLAFVCQAMATTVMTYNMISMQITAKQDHIKSMPNMAHCNNMKASASDDESISDCCSFGCHCLAVSNANVLVFTNVEFKNIIIPSSINITELNNLHINLIPTSLYKPPIIS